MYIKAPSYEFISTYSIVDIYSGVRVMNGWWQPMKPDAAWLPIV
jgi:hypothetical protein